MAVTQNEIARITGLSRSTVSTILAGKFAANYSEETRMEVIDTARRLNYRPNRQALILKTGKSGIIGIVHTGSILPLTHQKIAETVRTITQQKLEPLVYHNTWFENSAGITEILLANRVQGVILINNYYESRSSDLEHLAHSVPIVQFGGYKCPGIPLVAPDKAAVIEEIVHHLAQAGHRKIFMMATGMPDSPMLNPVSAFLRAFESPKLRKIAHEVVTIQGEEGDSVDVFAPGARLLEVIKARLDGPAAVIAHNDNFAIGLYLRCLEEGIRVPEDLAITGSDNVILGRRLPTPLTTVEQPIVEMARRSMEILLNGSIDPDLMELFRCRLIVRASCGG